jgi:hypothetical protein
MTYFKNTGKFNDITQHMFYREFSVRPKLREYIHCIWVMQAGKVVFANADLLVPDGNIEVILNYGDAVTLYLPGGPTTKNKPRRISGSTLRLV